MQLYKKNIALAMWIVSASLAQADEWSQEVNLVKVEPLVSWGGGVIRTVVDSAVASSLCGSNTVVDFVYSGGSAESRAAVVSALYMAFALGKPVRFYLSTAACSPGGAPILTGIDLESD